MFALMTLWICGESTWSEKKQKQLPWVRVDLAFLLDRGGGQIWRPYTVFPFRVVRTPGSLSVPLTSR
jgi:hypothetical protein